MPDSGQQFFQIAGHAKHRFKLGIQFGVFVFAGVIILPFIWILGFSASNQRLLAEDGVPVTGKIVRVTAAERTSRGARNTRRYIHTTGEVLFEDAQGNVHTMLVDVHPDVFKKYWRGTESTGQATVEPPEEVALIYLPGDPANAILAADLMPDKEVENLDNIRLGLKAGAAFCWLMVAITGWRLWRSRSNSSSQTT